jgi:hypothetical protein
VCFPIDVIFFFFLKEEEDREKQLTFLDGNQAKSGKNVIKNRGHFRMGIFPFFPSTESL